MGGSTSDPKYTVLYKGYDTTEIVTSASLKSLKNAVETSVKNGLASTTKRPSSSTTKLTPEEEQERERKRKRSEKKAERSANKSAEANAMQNTWQKFAKKAEKKGTLKTDKSMFKTPDDPLAKGKSGLGKDSSTPFSLVLFFVLTIIPFFPFFFFTVGVVGAGRGMTQYGDRKKHLYDAD